MKYLTQAATWLRARGTRWRRARDVCHAGSRIAHVARLLEPPALLFSLSFETSNTPLHDWADRGKRWEAGQCYTWTRVGMQPTRTWWIIKWAHVRAAVVQDVQWAQTDQKNKTYESEAWPQSVQSVKGSQCIGGGRGCFLPLVSRYNNDEIKRQKKQKQTVPPKHRALVQRSKPRKANC